MHVQRAISTDKNQRKSNTTSSILTSGTISEPRLSEIIASVSTMLHCQMMRDVSADVDKKKMLPYFCEEQYTGKEIKEMPTAKTINGFIANIFQVGQFNPECCIIALVYINRLIGVTGLPLTQSNWKPVTVSSILLAQKVWDDTPLINADFSILYPSLTKKEVNMLERKFLSLLNFKLHISPSLYAQYYFELRSVSEEQGQTLKLKPLSKAQARRLETRSHLSEEYQRKKHDYKKKTMTEDELRVRPKRTILS